MVLQNVDKAELKLKMKKDNVAGTRTVVILGVEDFNISCMNVGVKLPVFETYADGSDSKKCFRCYMCVIVVTLH